VFIHSFIRSFIKLRMSSCCLLKHQVDKIGMRRMNTCTTVKVKCAIHVIKSAFINSSFYSYTPVTLVHIRIHKISISKCSYIHTSIINL